LNPFDDARLCRDHRSRASASKILALKRRTGKKKARETAFAGIAGNIIALRREPAA
jgi:hypothetical protein